MNKLQRICSPGIYCAIVLLIQACATSQIPISKKDDSSAIAISIDADSRSAFARVESITAKQVMFIKLKSMEDALSKDLVYTSNYIYEPFMAGFQFGGYDAFVLDIEPGIYAAVGMIGSGSGTRVDFLIYFPEKMVKETIVEVKLGMMTYMGKFKLKKVSYNKLMDIPDKVQSHYYSNRIFDKEGQFHGKRKVSHYLSPQFHSPDMKSFKKSKEYEIEFLKRHKSSLSSGGWDKHISRRLDMLTIKK